MSLGGFKRPFAAGGLAEWRHPFGPHGRETPEQILDPKRSEIAANGWTLWPFQYRRPELLEVSLLPALRQDGNVVQPRFACRVQRRTFFARSSLRGAGVNGAVVGQCSC